MTALAPCARCDGYELVPAAADANRLVPCPDCRAVRCPVHGCRVAARIGVIVGTCKGCVRDANRAEQLLRVMPALLARRARTLGVAA